MASGSAYVYTTGNVIRLWLYWTATPDNDNNRSLVKVKALLERSADYNTCSTNNVHRLRFKVNGITKIDYSTFEFYVKTPYNGKDGYIKKDSSTGQYEFSFYISHNADGKLEDVNIQALFTPGETAGSYIIKNTIYTVTDIGDFDTIPRASQPTVSSSNVTMGNSITINTNRADDSFTHQINYVFAGHTLTTGLSQSTGVGSSCTFTPPKSLANYIPNNQSGVATIYCRTYSGSTLVGIKTVNVNINISSDIKPTVSASVTDPTGYKNIFGAYVADKSKINVDLSSAGSYGSTIAANEINMNGSAYTSDPSTSDVIKSTAYNTITYKVKDSRNVYSNQGSTNISILSYAAPKINLFSVSRCDSDGTANDDGLYAKVTYDVEITSLNSNNTKTLLLKYKKVADISYNQQSINIPTYDESGTVIVAADGLYSYDFSLELSDYFTTVTSAMKLSTSFTLMDWHSSGKGVAFGKLAEMEGIAEFDLPVYSNKGIFDENGLKQPVYKNVNGLSMNDVSETGFYRGYSMTDAAIQAISVFVVIQYSEDWIMQMQYGISSSGTHREFRRIRYNGTTWSSWEEKSIINIDDIDVNYSANTIVKRDSAGEINTKSKINFSNGDYIRYNDTDNKWYVSSDGGAERELIDSGNLRAYRVNITPVADTPTYTTLNFGVTYNEPIVQVTPNTSVPGSTVKAVSATNIGPTSCRIYIYRTNTTSTTMLVTVMNET